MLVPTLCDSGTLPAAKVSLRVCAEPVVNHLTALGTEQAGLPKMQPFCRLPVPAGGLRQFTERRLLTECFHSPTVMFKRIGAIEPGLLRVPGEVHTGLTTDVSLS